MECNQYTLVGGNSLRLVLKSFALFHRFSTDSANKNFRGSILVSRSFVKAKPVTLFLISDAIQQN